ncbi:MAG: hypothetical protein KC466_08430, partial [Myxococcales bacterium]|nr:hypothetical protein [Myxococcales bacterium]
MRKGSIVLTILAGFLGTGADSCTPEPPAKLKVGLMVHLEGRSFPTESLFDDYADLLSEYATLFETHGAKLTWESKEPTLASILYDNNVLLALEGRGHGVGVHADLGYNGGAPYTQAEFVSDLALRRAQLDLTGVQNRHVSGICSELDWVTAAANAGFEFTTGAVAYCYMSLPYDERPEAYRDCATPATCHQPISDDIAELIHPWRMADGATWTTADPAGPLVLLPSAGGLACHEEEHGGTSGSGCEFTTGDIESYTAELEEAIAAVEPGMVNQYYVSWSLGEALDPDLLDQW